MNRNPIVPYLITMALGIILIIGLSGYGLSNPPGEGGEAAEEQATPSNPEEIYAASCVSCHGNDLEGGVGPALVDVGSRLSADEIKGVIENGQGSMPGGLAQGEAATMLAEWLAEKK
ncbi:cytochrome c550 [Bacillus solimangrovi]|uniref:Cytochrome c domain-containing protein n=1 Tax=Bacillus solimangrovi TaxID=1305675 RepID=A0A1E5LI37_9BACI|nr:cytochrome c [Bacillus solimangrovi]OEH93716.1 hypothetical protein BFG57_11810 [Bacillus solimangrovi]